MSQAGRATRVRHEAHAGAVAAAYQRAAADRWQVSHETFAAAVTVAVEKRFDEVEAAGTAVVEAFIGTLHASDLALACACRDGHPEAWDHFVLSYRPELYRAARAIAGDQGRELADSLYAELFGLPGPRRRAAVVAAATTTAAAGSGRGSAACCHNATSTASGPPAGCDRSTIPTRACPSRWPRRP